MDRLITPDYRILYEEAVDRIMTLECEIKELGEELDAYIQAFEDAHNQLYG